MRQPSDCRAEAAKKLSQKSKLLVNGESTAGCLVPTNVRISNTMRIFGRGDSLLDASSHGAPLIIR
jgi:hypothetical protein